ncbi:hypothetical protein SSOG_02360 [Streptomyces himastatinicus ATCC 53653]|uniref:Uncharacterized protein n=1 Tax=Streptomyces himastatinicus ATCC 53653 TaxID=457427 RepID=D9W8D9_9ACTN|nr:hypothetical protein [Streptomyces himastatinicus]EFL22646.1 hypothetical protein SSOG_02360 [Streptomyces himastatinicus ATCC 53653]
MFPLPRGATGFSRPEHGPLPETDARAFRTALHAAARAAGGRVGTVEERTYPRTFHTASIIRRDDERVVLCHAHHPWIAFAEERRTWYDDGFASPPPWSGVFPASGFDVLTAEHLGTPLADLDTSGFSRAERHQISCFGITTLGGVLFNAWD